MCDSDTVLDPACTIEMLRVLEEDPQVGGVGGDVQVRHGQGPWGPGVGWPCCQLMCWAGLAVATLAAGLGAGVFLWASLPVVVTTLHSPLLALRGQ